MNCAFCARPVQFSQGKMAHRIFELDAPENEGWLCRDCAEIRDEGHKTEGITGPRADCVDCDDEVDYGVAIMKQTPGGDVTTDGTVYQVLCESHFDDRAT